MNKIYAYLKNAAKTAVAAAMMCLSLQSCDGVIYDDEGDCSVRYRMKFAYDMNMKWADAFSNEVKSVRLYAFDAQGKLVWQKTESGARLAADDYAMEIDLPAGKYHFVAWAGLDNEGAAEKHFTVAGGRADNALTLDALTCSLNRTREGDKAVSSKRLDGLYHAMADIELPSALSTGGTFEYKMHLTKDTNRVRVILQHISGADVNVNDFFFQIEEENGLMNHDNSLLDDEMITYRPHDMRNGTAGMGIDDYPEYGKDAADGSGNGDAVTKINVAMADMTIARLVEGRKTYLTIRANSDNHLVARVPLVDYALMLKDGYGHEMTDQEYLDRQDDYTLTFFLDRNQKWIGTSIIINSWKVVLSNVDFD